jgi:adenylate cyclase
LPSIIRLTGSERMAILGKPRSLTIHVTVAFAVLFTVLAAALIGFSHMSSRALVLDAARKLADARLDVLATETQAKFERIELAVQAIAADPRIGDPQAFIADHRQLLSHFADIQDLDGFYVGYPNGAFFHVVSPERSDAWRVTLKAPDTAIYAMRLIAPGIEGSRQSVWTFHDSQGTKIGAGPSGAANFDPRERPWYRNAEATSGVTWTSSYVFATTREVGLTMSMAATSAPGVVVGADVTLTRLGAMLDRQKISPSTRIVLFDGRGRLVAFSGMDISAFDDAPSSDGKRIGPTIRQAGDGSLAVVLNAVQRETSGASFGPAIANNNDRYVISSKPVNVSDQQLHAVMGAPVQELMSEVTRHSRNALLVSAFIALASLPIIYFVAQLVARPLNELSLEAKKLKNFNVGEPVTTRSPIREVQRLADAMRAAKAGLSTFGLYVPKELVRQVLASGIKPTLGGEERDLTIMFLDLHGFTTFAERSTPSEITRLLSDFFSLASDEIIAGGGCVDKFIGDGIMAIWNAPVLTPDHALRACQCALNIQARLAEANAFRRKSDLPALQVRIGIHSGRAVIGNVGSADRLEYTAIGDAVNIAARLEALNKEFHTEILVSGEVAARIRDHLDVVAKGRAALKGRMGRVEVHALRGHEGKVTSSEDPIAEEGVPNMSRAVVV